MQKQRLGLASFALSLTDHSFLDLLIWHMFTKCQRTSSPTQKPKGWVRMVRCKSSCKYTAQLILPTTWAASGSNWLNNQSLTHVWPLFFLGRLFKRLYLHMRNRVHMMKVDNCTVSEQ